MTVCSLSLQISPASKNRAPIHPSWERQILKARSVSYLFPSSWALRCVLCEIFLKVFGSGQSDVRSGTSMPPCCVVNAITLYTLIHWIISNTAHAQTVDYLRVGRAMFCHAILITRIPWLVHVRVHHATRSHRSWAHLKLPRRKTFKTSKQWR